MAAGAKDSAKGICGDGRCHSASAEGQREASRQGHICWPCFSAPPAPALCPRP